MDERQFSDEVRAWAERNGKTSEDLRKWVEENAFVGKNKAEGETVEETKILGSFV